MMVEAMLDLVVFFAVLFAGLAVAFVGLRKAGVSFERVGHGAKRVLERAPLVRHLMAFSRRHRKAVGWVGTVLVICLAPFALVGVVVVIGSVAAFYFIGHYGYLLHAEESDDEKSLRLRGKYADGSIPCGSGVIGNDGDVVPKGSGDAWRPII